MGLGSRFARHACLPAAAAACLLGKSSPDAHRQTPHNKGGRSLVCCVPAMVTLMLVLSVQVRTPLCGLQLLGNIAGLSHVSHQCLRRGTDAGRSCPTLPGAVRMMSHCQLQGCWPRTQHTAGASVRPARVTDS